MCGFYSQISIFVQLSSSKWSWAFESGVKLIHLTWQTDGRPKKPRLWRKWESGWRMLSARVVFSFPKVSHASLQTLEVVTKCLAATVVGDRRLLRFLRGKSYRMDDSVKAYKDFLKWRDDNDIDTIRQDIVYGGKDSAFKFPFGELALAVAPQIILTANAQDKKGRLLG